VTRLSGRDVACLTCKYRGGLDLGGSDGPNLVICLNSNSEHYLHSLYKWHACPEGKLPDEIAAAEE